MRLTLALSGVLLGILHMLNGAACAGTASWNVDDDGNWADTANWDPNITFPNAQGETATFGQVISAPRVITLHQDMYPPYNAGARVGTVVFDSAQPYTIAGSYRLVMNRTSGASIIEVQQGSHVVSAGVLLSTANNDNNNMNFNIAGGGLLTVTGLLEGTRPVFKLGDGTLTLSGPNTYTGGTTIDAGRITIGNLNALGSGLVTVNAAGTLGLNGHNIANAITLAGGTLDVGSTGTVSSTVTLNNVAGNTIRVSGNYRELDGRLTGPGGFTLTGSSTPGLTLSNPDNDFTGDVVINSGAYLRLTAGEVIPDVVNVTNNGHLRLDIPGGGTETIAGLSGSGSVWVPTTNNAMHTLVVGTDNATSTYAGTIGRSGQNNAFLRLIKTGTGTLTLNGDNPYRGGTTINAGTVSLGHDDALGTGTVTLAGGTLRPSGARTLANNLVAEAGTDSNLLDNVGSGDLILRGSLSGSGSLTINSTLSRSIWFQGDNSGFTGMLNFTNNNNGTNLRLGGTGTSQNNSDNGADFSGATFVLSGNTTNNRGMSWNGAADTAVSIGSLSGTGQIGHTARAANWHIGALNTDTTFDGIIEGGSALTKVGTGTLTLRGKNTYTGGTTVSGGTLVLRAPTTNWNVGVFGGTAKVESGATLQIDTGWNTSSNDTINVLGGGTLHYSAPYTAGGGNTTYVGTITLDSSNEEPAVVTGVGAVRMGHNANGLISSAGLATNMFAAGLQLVSGSGRTVTIETAAGNTLNFSGLISDYTGLAGTPLIKTGDGTLTLSGSNTYVGTTTVNAGTLAIAPGGQLYQTGGFFGVQNQNYIIVNTGGTFQTWNWNYGAANALAELRHNYGQILLNGGTIRLDDTFESARAFSIGPNGGTLEVTAGNTYTKLGGTTAGENIIRFTADSTLTLAGAGNGILADPLGAYGSTGFALAKTGSGTWTLTGGNNYSGGTTVHAGTLLVNNTAGSGTGSGAVTVNNGATLGGTGSIAGTVTINAGGTHAPGASVGSQTVGGETWMPGGRFEFEINDAAGVPGGPMGWDRLLVDGTLDLTNLSAQDPFHIDIVSLAGTTAGDIANFAATEPYEWPFLRYETLAGEFSADLFSLDSSAFSNPTGRGYFQILQMQYNGGDWLAIGYVPEPGAWLLLLSALACGLLVRRRK